ncbi:hypothetical protein N7490_000319 [Penicillium lividum]|nr:hypothetical protein N7490_000319 [Penicillium lividum]
MVLREHFEASNDAQSSMILTVSPGAAQYAATMNTLEFGDLVGLANGQKGLLGTDASFQMFKLKHEDFTLS